MSTTVHVLMIADHTITDAPATEGATPASRSFDRGRKYPVSLADARAMISEGVAGFIEVPHQDGFPRGSLDSNRLADELAALSPKMERPAPQPEPLPEDPPATPTK